MKLLITTQVVDKNDPALGFFHRWIEEFAKHCESIEVICLKEGVHALPENVRVHSLGKENAHNKSIFSSFLYAIRFKVLIFKLRNQYDEVFVHMNPEYIVLGGIFWRLWKKRIGLWYLHRSVTLRLRIAEVLTNVIFTASPESFRLKSSKLQIVGHGIDLSQFQNEVAPHRAEERPQAAHNDLRILTTGRYSPAKRIMEMLQVLDVLHARHIPFHFTLAGGPGIPANESYVATVRAAIASRPYHEQVSFLGPVPHTQIPDLLSGADVFLNLSTTGSLDKAVLEAFASGIPAVTSNVAFKTFLEPLGLFVSAEDPQAEQFEKIAGALMHASKVDPAQFRAFVEKHHSLTILIPRILELLAARS